MVNMCESSRFSSPKKPVLTQNQYLLNTLYPNPASDFVTVIISQEISSDVFVEIQNNLGQTIINKKIVKEHTSKISVEYLKNGVYSYLIKINNQCIGSGKLVIIH